MSLNQQNIKPVILSAPFSNLSKAVKCSTCFRQCVVMPGKKGFCQTKINKSGKLYSVIYGILSDISVDPIEEKPFYHFKNGTKTLSIGSFGCNFRCKGCMNSKVSWGNSEVAALDAGNLIEGVFVPPAVVIQMAQDLNCEGIAFTFNEPAIWLEYVVDVAKLAKEKNLYTAYVTNSSLSKASIDILAGLVDAIATDIKNTENEFYQSVCGAVKVVDTVLSNIKYAAHKGIHIETRTNIIPGLNDGPETVKNIALWIKNNLGEGSPWHLTKFYPANLLLDLPVTPQETIDMAIDIARTVGLKNVYSHEKPCDCAKSIYIRKIKDLLLKYQSEGVVLGERW